MSRDCGFKSSLIANASNMLPQAQSWENNPVIKYLTITGNENLPNHWFTAKYTANTMLHD